MFIMLFWVPSVSSALFVLGQLVLTTDIWGQDVVVITLPPATEGTAETGHKSFPVPTATVEEPRFEFRWYNPRIHTLNHRVLENVYIGRFEDIFELYNIFLWKVCIHVSVCSKWVFFCFNRAGN